MGLHCSGPARLPLPQDDFQTLSWIFKPFVIALPRASSFLSSSIPGEGPGPPDSFQSLSWCPLPPGLGSHCSLCMAPTSGPSLHPHIPPGYCCPFETLVSQRRHLSELPFHVCVPRGFTCWIISFAFLSCVHRTVLPMAWSSLRVYLYPTPTGCAKVCSRRDGKKQEREEQSVES